MNGLDEVLQFIFEAVSANAAKKHGSIVTIKIAPYHGRKKIQKTKAITESDIINMSKVLDRFDGDFRKLFGNK